MKRLVLNEIRRGLGKAYIELEKSNDKNEYLDTLIFQKLDLLLLYSVEYKELIYKTYL